MDLAVSVQPALGSVDVVRQTSRKYETPKQWCRSTRVYCEPGRCDAWFFQTREGVDVGPYLSQFAAEVEASLLKELLAQEDCPDTRLLRIADFMQESLELEQNLA